MLFLAILMVIKMGVEKMCFTSILTSRSAGKGNGSWIRSHCLQLEAEVQTWQTDPMIVQVKADLFS